MVLKLSIEQIKFIESHYNADLVNLRLQFTESRSDINFLIAQIKGRRKATEKLPEWAANPNIIYPKYLSLEQSSSQWTAKRKALLFNKNAHVLDMTGGMGIDAFYISQYVATYTLVENQKDLAEINQHNFGVFARENIRVINAESTQFLSNSDKVYDHIYIDPARRNRDDSGRAFLLEDFRPKITEIQSLLWQKTKHIVVKLAPMLDISSLRKSIHHISDIYVIAWKNEVKELLISMEKLERSCRIHAINILDSEMSEEYYCSDLDAKTSIKCSTAQRFLYEPNKAILKANLQDLLAVEFDLLKIAPNTHFYSSTLFRKDYQGRAFEIIRELPSKPKAFRKLYSHQKANIISRNHPLSANQIADRFGLIMGGDKYIIAFSDIDKRGKILEVRRLK